MVGNTYGEGWAACEGIWFRAALLAAIALLKKGYCSLNRSVFVFWLQMSCFTSAVKHEPRTMWTM